MEHNLANLEGNLGVVNHKGNLSCSICQHPIAHAAIECRGRHTLNEADDLARSPADLAQGIGGTLGGTSNGRASSRCDARQALLSPGSGVLGGLGSLLGSGALEASGGDAEGRRAEHGTGERRHGGGGDDEGFEKPRGIGFGAPWGDETCGGWSIDGVEADRDRGRGRLREKKSSGELAGWWLSRM